MTRHDWRWPLRAAPSAFGYERIEMKDFTKIRNGIYRHQCDMPVYVVRHPTGWVWIQKSDEFSSSLLFDKPFNSIRDGCDWVRNNVENICSAGYVPRPVI